MNNTYLTTNKKKILYVCYTHYQIIMAVHMAMTLKKDCENSLIITNHSKNASIYYENVKKINLFKNVYFAETNLLKHKHTSICNIYYAMSLLFCKNIYFKFLKNQIFDELYAYNFDNSIRILLRWLMKHNPNLIFNRFEEGILSYNYILQNKYQKNLSSMKERIKDFIGFYDIDKYSKDFYCIYPCLYRGFLNTVRMPLIDITNKDLINNICKIFSVDNNILNYPQKYIYFSSIHDFEGGEPVGELELVKKIAELVGKENLLIKVHPRDNVKRFIEAGLIIDKNSNVPWEVIQLNYNFSNHVFLTSLSTSVLNINSIINNPPKTYFLYKLINSEHNELAKKSIENLNQILNNAEIKDIFSFVNVPISLEKIL